MNRTHPFAMVHYIPKPATLWVFIAIRGHFCVDSGHGYKVGTNT